LSANDAAGILVGTVTIKPYSMRASAHEEGGELGMTGAGGFALVDFAIRNADPQIFQALLPVDPETRKPLPGGGDEAYYFVGMASKIPDAVESDSLARERPLTCIVQRHRSKGAEKLVIPASNTAIATELGGLCTKVLAARSGKEPDRPAPDGAPGGAGSGDRRPACASEGS
jgi:hypothetical protein